MMKPAVLERASGASVAPEDTESAAVTPSECRADGCKELAPGTSGYCARHFGRGGRESARQAERELLEDPARDWRTRLEAADLAECSPVTIDNATERGELQATKVGKHKRYPVAEVKDWAERRRKPKKRCELPPKQRRELVRKLRGEDKPIREIAELLGCSKRTVVEDVDALGLERPGKGLQSQRLPPEERRDRIRQAVVLYAQGRTDVEIASELSVSPTQVARDLQAAGVTRRPAAPRPSGPPPEARPCDGCGRTFTPSYPSHDGRLFCSDSCARDWRADQARIAVEERGLLSTRRAGERSARGDRFALDLVDRGLLRTELIEFPGMIRPVHGIDAAALNRALREWALGGDGRRRAALNPDYAIARAERNGRIDRMMAERGMTRGEAHDVIRGRVERHRKILRDRSKGPQHAAPSTRDLRWLRQITELREERAYHQQQLELKLVDDQDGERYREALEGARRSDRSIAEEIAERDRRDHQGENFALDEYPPAPGDPGSMRGDMRRPASEVVLKAVRRAEKALQSAGTEKHTP